MRAHRVYVTRVGPDGKPTGPRIPFDSGDVTWTMPGFEVRDQAQVDAEELVREGAIAAWNGVQR